MLDRLALFDHGKEGDMLKTKDISQHFWIVTPETLA